MASEQVDILERAENSIFKFAKYIDKQGYPDRAFSFISEIYEFINSLSISGESFAVCRHKAFSKKKYKCIPYKKAYIIILSIQNDIVTIHNIIPSKKIR